MLQGGSQHTSCGIWPGGGFVKERILNYMAYIDQLLADDAGKNEEDYEKIMEEHKLQLTFCTGSMMRCTSVHGRKVTRPKNDMICQAEGMR